ncbi:MAG TPA: protein kinase [Kofleriaceae bacterium]|nr:protein kinase [Kofleriaceae bacterium]
MAPDVPGSLVGERVGKYDVLALLALGGTAEIYLARIGGEAGFEKLVVVKCLHEHLADSEDFVTMFLDEARLGAQLDHSNIVQMLELGQHNGRYFIVMEYLAGMSLAQMSRAGKTRIPGGRLPVDVTLCLATQACAGLHYAHERTADGRPLNIVHRDISPQNLVISFDGSLKVVDFGIAKADARQTRTATGTIKGKFAYMAPEQALAQPVDRRTDVFALGVVVHELLTGARLFKRESAYETYQAIVKGEIAPPSTLNPEVDAEVDKVVLTALAREADHRFPSAQAFGETLLGVLHHRGQSASATTVGRFLDKHFTLEIDEHAARMRDVLEGHRASAMSGSWDASDVDDSGDDEVSELEPPSMSLRKSSAVQNDFAEAGETQIELDPMDKFRFAQMAGAENQRTLLDPECGPPEAAPLPGLPGKGRPAPLAKPGPPPGDKPKKTMLMGAPVLRPSRPAKVPSIPPIKARPPTAQPGRPPTGQPRPPTGQPGRPPTAQPRPLTAPPRPSTAQPGRPLTAPPRPPTAQPGRPLTAPPRPPTAPPRPPTAQPGRPPTAPPRPPTARPATAAASAPPATADASAPTLFDAPVAAVPAPQPAAAKPALPGPGPALTSLPTTNWEAARPPAPSATTAAASVEPTLVAMLIAFVISAGIGLGATLLLGSLF